MIAEYVDHMGSDLTVVNSARVSFDKTQSAIGSRDERLINYLAEHNHFTPFTHAMITLRETVPIFVARQRFKHTVGFSYNEVSRRYVDDEPQFFTPDAWRSRPVGGLKQGSGEGVVENVRYNLSLVDTDNYVERPIDETYRHVLATCKDAYQRMIDAGVAPEQARMVLPQSMYTSYYVTGSLAAFARAYALRADGHAQREIQELAAQWKQLIEPLFPISWKALTENA